MRATIHLLTSDDALAIRPLVQPVLDAELGATPSTGRACATSTSARPRGRRGTLLDERPLTTTELRAALAERVPGLDAPAAAYACRCLLALVQVPPRGLWRRSGTVRLTTLEAWVGRALDAAPSLDRLVLRYLGAFGPATVADVATWSRLTGLRPVLERLRPGLATFRDERGRELFDLPDAPRPDPKTPAPPRFLPEYDNVLLRTPTGAGSSPTGCGRTSPGSRASGTAGSSTTGSSSASGASRTARSSCGTPTR